MAREQVRGEGAGPVTDVWTLAVVLYETLAGTPPFHQDGAVATFKAILEDPLISLRTGRSGVPLEFDRIVLDALEKDRGKRTSTAADLRDALAALLPSLPAEPLPESAFAEEEDDARGSDTAPTRVI